MNDSICVYNQYVRQVYQLLISTIHGCSQDILLGGQIIYSYVKFINIWYTKWSNLKYNNIISKLESMHLKLKLKDKIS